MILGFIGVKLVLDALHGQGVSWAPEIGIVPRSLVIVLVLGITTVLSLLKVRRDPSAAKHLPTARSAGSAAGSGPGTGEGRRPTHGATAATHGATAAIGGVTGLAGSPWLRLTRA